MKKFFGKMLVGIAGCVLAVSLGAFAAEDPAVTLGDVVADKSTGSVTISGVVSGEAEAKEATIIVAPEDVTSLALIEDENIKYIDQNTATDGAFSFSFKLTPGVKYNVWCGGTDVAVDGIGSGVIDLTADVAGYKIIGTVSILEGADLSKVEAVAGTIAGTVDAETGKYEIEVEAGTYTVVIGRDGYLYRTVKDVVVTDKDVDLGETNLLAGNIVKAVDDAEEVINLDDLQLLLYVYNSSKGDDNYDEAVDLNDSDTINIDDLQALLFNFNKTETTAYSAE